MLTKHVVIAGVAALLLGACGEGSLEAPAQESLDSIEQPLLYKCPTSFAWTRDWFVDGVEVGSETCSCQGVLTKYGTPRGDSYEQRRFECVGTPDSPEQAGSGAREAR